MKYLLMLLSVSFIVSCSQSTQTIEEIESYEVVNKSGSISVYEPNWSGPKLQSWGAHEHDDQIIITMKFESPVIRKFEAGITHKHLKGSQTLEIKKFKGLPEYLISLRKSDLPYEGVLGIHVGGGASQRYILIKDKKLYIGLYDDHHEKDFVSETTQKEIEENEKFINKIKKG